MTTVKIVGMWSVVFACIAIWFKQSSTVYFFRAFSSIELFYIACGMSSSLFIFALLHIVRTKAKSKKQHTRMDTLLIGFISCFFFIPICLFIIPFVLKTTYIELTSEKSNGVIVVREQQQLLTGRGEVYEKTGFFSMKKRASYDTNNQSITVEGNNYEFKWERNRVFMYERGTTFDKDSAIVIYFHEKT